MAGLLLQVGASLLLQLLLKFGDPGNEIFNLEELYTKRRRANSKPAILGAQTRLTIGMDSGAHLPGFLEVSDRFWSCKTHSQILQ
jgi:hypothetical protein